MDEKELYENVCEENLFASLYEKYAQELHDYLYYRYGERLDPYDKAQEAFIKLWENCGKVAFNKARSFLYTVCNNMMLNEIKHQKVVLRHHESTTESFNNEDPEYLMRKKEYLDQYQKVLEQLSEEQRTAFLLNKVEGKKHEEIAALLGVTRKVVEYRIYSAFKVLQENLENFRVK